MICPEHGWNTSTMEAPCPHKHEVEHRHGAFEYRVLSGASAKSLEEQVVDLSRDGFEPIGGVSVAHAVGESSLVGP